jgi:cytochrome c oxidase cbb3-type subunit 1
MSQPSISKSMTIGESGLAVVFAATAFFCVIASAKALDAPFAFHAALFLASDEANFITGVTLPVDGGASVRRG